MCVHEYEEKVWYLLCGRIYAGIVCAQTWRKGGGGDGKTIFIVRSEEHLKYSKNKNLKVLSLLLLTIYVYHTCHIYWMC